MTKLKMLVALSFVALLGGQAKATIAVATGPTWAAASLIAAAPTGSVTVIKSVTVANDSTSNACAYLYASSTVNSTKANLKLTVCALAGTTVTWPQAAPANNLNSIQGAASAFLGELMSYSGIVSLNTGVIDSSKLVSFVQVAYQYQSLR